MHRNSVIEIGRIFAVIGIVGLHLYGEIHTSISFVNSLIEVLYCEIFCMAVPFFILISGYYSVTFKYQKLVKLHIMVLFYSIVELIIMIYYTGHIGATDIISAVFPILSYRYWYFSCYFLLVIFSGVINWITDNVPQKLFLLALCGWMVIVDSVTCLPLFELKNDGLWVMLFYYCAGRYIRKYGLHFGHRHRDYLKVGIGISVISFVINIVFSFVLKRGVSWLATDSFILKEISIILIFYYLISKEWQNSFVNFISSCAPAVYAGEGAVRSFINSEELLSDNLNSTILVVKIFLIAIVVFSSICVLEKLRSVLFGRLEIYYAAKCEKIYELMVKRIKNTKTFDRVYRWCKW